MPRAEGRLRPYVGLALLLGWLVSAIPVFAADVRNELVKSSTIEQILQRGALKVGFSTFVPWAMQNKNGEFIGFEIDVARRLAKDMGVTLELVPTKWSGIIPSLLTGKFDLLIGGMTITPERNAKVNFSTPYSYSGMSLVADRTRAKDYATLADFNQPGVLVVARIGTTAAAAAKKHLPRAELRLFDEEPQAVQELLNGRAHALVAMAPLPATLALRHPDKLFLPLAEPFTKEPNGIALRKGDVDTLNYVNNWIAAVQAEDWIQERYRYWFESLDWEKDVQ